MTYTGVDDGFVLLALALEQIAGGVGMVNRHKRIRIAMEHKHRRLYFSTDISQWVSGRGCWCVSAGATDNALHIISRAEDERKVAAEGMTISPRWFESTYDRDLRASRPCPRISRTWSTLFL